MYKYLETELEQAHGAYIENLIFLPNELIRRNNSDSFEDFKNLSEGEICKTLGWRQDEDVFSQIREYLSEDESFAYFLSNNNKNGFLAECYFPECSNFNFPIDSEEPSSWSVGYGCCRIEWIYANSIGEMVSKMIKTSNSIFSESVEKFKEEKN